MGGGGGGGMILDSLFSSGEGGGGLSTHTHTHTHTHTLQTRLVVLCLSSRTTKNVYITKGINYMVTNKLLLLVIPSAFPLILS